MTVREFVQRMNMKVLTSEVGMENEVTGMYVCDLLSFVMSHAKKKDAWITVQTNINTVAVAVLTEVSLIILPEDIEAEELTLKKATQEGVPIVSSSLTAYEICIKAGRFL